MDCPRGHVTLTAGVPQIAGVSCQNGTRIVVDTRGANSWRSQRREGQVKADSMTPGEMLAGCLLGKAAGDALGFPVKGCSTDDCCGQRLPSDRPGIHGLPTGLMSAEEVVGS